MIIEDVRLLKNLSKDVEFCRFITTNVKKCVKIDGNRLHFRNKLVQSFSNETDEFHYIEKHEIEREFEMKDLVTTEEIVKLHMEQQLERKKAIYVNLKRLDMQNSAAEKKVPGEEKIFTAEDFQRYSAEGTVSLSNGVFLKQLGLPNYFRGENAYYPTCKACACRGCDADVSGKRSGGGESVGEGVADIAAQEKGLAEKTFTKAFLKLEEVKACQNVTVLPGIVAQDYGIASEWMGFTSNFDEALFYACCTRDEKTGEWRPLEQKDFSAPGEEDGADRRYGVIYMADAYTFSQGEGAEYNIMTPAGSQPLMRSRREYAYAMRLSREDDLAKDARFQRLVFKHSEKLCRDIFEKMNRGADLYEDEKCPQIESLLAEFFGKKL